MVHVIQQVANNASAFGEMLKYPSRLPDGVTTDDLLSFLQDLINEQHFAYDLKNADWNEVKKEISDYFDVKMTKEKRKLVAEESSEAAMEVVAGGAAIASVACSYIPLVNFAIEAVAVVAIATQTGLEIAIEKLQDNIMEDLANADTNIAKKPSFVKIKPYSEAVKKNTSMFPRLGIGGRTDDLRAMFLSFVVAAKKLNPTAEVTVDALKKQFIDVWDASNDSDLGPIMEEYTRILSGIDDNIALGGTPPDSDDISKDFDPLLAEVNPHAKFVFASIMLTMMGVISIRHGKQAYGLWQDGKTSIEANGTELVSLNEENAVATVEELEESGVVAEVSTLSKMEIAVKGVSALAAVASLVFAGLEITAAVNTEKNLTEAFEKAKNAIINYYRHLLGVPNEYVPKAPFQDGLTLIEASTEVDWGREILGQNNWTDIRGTFNTSKQCMESVNEYEGGDSNWVVTALGPINAVKRLSYICVGGIAAKYVDVAIYPGGKYLGYNGITFTSDPAISVNGYYWYKLEVDLHAPFAASSSTFYAKAYRLPKSMKSGNFNIWAFEGMPSQAQNGVPNENIPNVPLEVQNGVPNENFPKAPFPVGLTPIEAGMEDDWAKAILGQNNWTVQDGTLNTSKQCMESVNESKHGNGMSVVITSGPINAVKMTSYVCVSGTAAKYVDVAVYPGGKYLGYNGSTFTSNPAISVDGHYWYKLEVNLHAPFAASSGVFYAKTYRAPKSMKSGNFKIWAFNEMSSQA